MVGLIGAWRNNWIHPCNKWFGRKIEEKTRQWDFNCEVEKIFLALCIGIEILLFGKGCLLLWRKRKCMRAVPTRLHFLTVTRSLKSRRIRVPDSSTSGLAEVIQIVLAEISRSAPTAAITNKIICLWVFKISEIFVFSFFSLIGRIPDLFARVMLSWRKSKMIAEKTFSIWWKM